MTIRQRKHIQNFLQQKKTTISNENSGKLSQFADQQLRQMPDVKQRLWKTLRHAAAHQQHVDKQNHFNEESKQNGKKEDNGVYLSEEEQLDKDKISDEKIIDGCSDHLLILARSAEMMSESKDNFDAAYRSDQNHKENTIHDTIAGEKSLGNQVDRRCAIDSLRNEENVIHQEGRSLRLSQIRRQARSRNSLLMQQNVGGCTEGHVQDRRIRVTQIRHLARSKNHPQLQERIGKDQCGNSQGRIRLSQLRRHARSMSNSLAQEASEDHVHHFNCQTSQEICQRDRIIAEIFGAEDSFLGVADCHQSEPEVDNMDKYAMNGRVEQSVVVNKDTQDSMTTSNGRMHLRHL